MDKTNDIVVGFITGYTFDKIKTWVNSLDRSGFTGTKAMICYNIDYDTIEELTNRNYTIFAFKKNDLLKRTEYKPHGEFNICVDRFLHLWAILKNYKGQYRNIITTDVKDVVFQTDPSEWLDRNFVKEINLASESIRYRDEEWGNHNLYQSFGPVVHEAHKDNLIVNAGVLSGNFDTMLDVFLNIYMLSNGASSHHIQGGGGPDQAALNVLMAMKTYKQISNISVSESGWAAQLGTTGPQINHKYGSRLVEKSPIIVDDIVCTSEGTPFAIVHQYDRVPEWKIRIEKKYE